MKKRIISSVFLIMFALCLSGCINKDYKGNSDTAWHLGDYVGRFVGMRVEEDNEGGATLYVRFEFTNNSNEAISFEEALHPVALQGKGELQNLEEEIDPTQIPVPPGETHAMDIRYYTNDMRTLVEVRINNQFTGETFSASTGVK